MTTSTMPVIRKNRRQVDPDPALVDPVAEHDGEQDAEHRAHPAEAVALPLAWNVASRNTTVSKPSRSTARKAMTTSALADPAASADAGRALQVALEVPGVPAHPETM